MRNGSTKIFLHCSIFLKIGAPLPSGLHCFLFQLEPHPSKIIGYALLILNAAFNEFTKR